MGEELHADRVGFVQLQKYNRDTGEFEGVMASSAPDQSNEILDWQSSKPHFQRWFNTFYRNTKGASLGNVREMHQPIAAGKLTSVRFDDEKELLYVKGRVFHPDTRIKLEEAVLTGLSIGGDYGKRWPDPSKAGFTRYEAKPYEVSLVDNPCNPDAMLSLTNAAGAESMVKFASAATLELEAIADDPAGDAALAAAEDAGMAFAKAQATREGKQLSASQYAYVPDPAKPSTWKFPIDSPERIRNAIARWGQDTGIPDAARRKAWGRILRAADKLGVKITDRSYKLEGARTMSPDEIVGEELKKQEVFKAAVRDALFGKKGIAKRVRKTRKELKRFFEKFGEKGGLAKSYVSTIAGVLNDLSGQIDSLQAAFTPAVASGMPQSPGNSQPGENVGGGDGDMVTASPSSSGTGAMIPGVGVRAAAGGKKGKLSKKKLVRLLAENNEQMTKDIAGLIASIFKPPSPAELAKLDPETAGRPAAPVRLVKDAPDANKVAGTGGAVPPAAGGAAAAVADPNEPSEAVIKALQERAADVTDPLAAAKARVELDKISESAVKKSLRTALGGGLEAAGFRK